jgi:hypothetical protein
MNAGTEGVGCGDWADVDPESSNGMARSARASCRPSMEEDRRRAHGSGEPTGFPQSSTSRMRDVHAVARQVDRLA